ncbi:unnamed protein product [Rotaria socialis]|uniref:NAD(P)(+)--arginine ADP-ribosyltransferase n=1 Tax=Rotaria socialis TaxID=392032 RepID=A0A818G6C3_9BILA|nr:unnamed protein product [Rotaria socialis]CAF4556543.1 unnamed protein product [Rotaria socialis]
MTSGPRKINQVDNDLAIVWLDAKKSKESSNVDYLNRSIDFSTLISHIHVFDDVDQCCEYLLSKDQADKVLLIVSGSIGEKVLPCIHDITQIIGVYIFCNDVEKHREWAGTFSKVRDVFRCPKKLIERIQRDAQLLVHHIIPTNIFSFQNLQQTSLQNVDQDQSTYMWFQLLIDVLNRLPLSHSSRGDLIDESMQYYSNNTIEKRKIAEFNEKYLSSNEAVQWYTRDCFLYRLINRAFRTRDIDSIFKFRYFIHDLQHQLDHLHQEQQLSSVLPTTAYRGQIIGADELKKLQNNVGGIFCVNSFWSATTASQVATSFNMISLGRPYYERVIFEVTMELKQQPDKAKSKYPFANISHLSCNEDEGEVLFSMGCTFRIILVEQFSDEIWYVQLSLLDDSSSIDESLREYYLANHIEEQSSLLTMAYFFDQAGDYERAKRYCQMLLRENPSEDDSIDIHTSLALFEYRIGNFEAAKREGELALKLHLTQKVVDNRLSDIYANLGLVMAELGEYRDAIAYQHESVKIDELVLDEEDEEKAITYENLGMSYHGLGDYPNALKWCEEKALSHMQKYLPASHPGFQRIYLDIGMIYTSMGDYPVARGWLEKALDKAHSILPPLHKDLGNTFYNLGLLCEKTGEDEQGLNYFRQALNIALQSEKEDTTIDLAYIYVSMGAIYDNQGEFDEALRHYELALENLSVDKPEHRQHFATAYNNIGFVHIQQKKYKSALSYLQKAFKIVEKYLPRTHELYTLTLANIGQVYVAQDRLEEALECYRQVIDIRRRTLPKYHKDLAAIYDHLGEAYFKKGIFKTAIDYHKKALEIEVHALPLEHPSIKSTCKMLADVYKRIGNRKAAIKCYKEPILMARMCQKINSSLPSVDPKRKKNMI